MTLTIELSEAEAELLRQAAEDARSSEEDFVTDAVKRALEVKRRRGDVRSFLSEIRELTKDAPQLPDSAYHRSSYYEE